MCSDSDDVCYPASGPRFHGDGLVARMCRFAQWMGERTGPRIPACHPPPGRNTAERCSSSRRDAERYAATRHAMRCTTSRLCCSPTTPGRLRLPGGGPRRGPADRRARPRRRARRSSSGWAWPGWMRPDRASKPRANPPGRPHGSAARVPHIAERLALRPRRPTAGSPCVVTAADRPPRTPQRQLEETVSRRRGVRRPDGGRSSPVPRTRSPRRCAHSRCRTPCARDLPWPPPGTSRRASW